MSLFINGKANPDLKNLLKDILNHMDIFISHSSDDAPIAEAVVNLIKKAFNISSDKIRCTSVDGYKLRSGANTDQQLREEIFSSKVFVAILTPNSISSTYVLFELGARWGGNLPLLPLICDTAGVSMLQGPLKNIHSLNATVESDIHQFVNDIGRYLNVPSENAPTYLKEIGVLKELSKAAKQDNKLTAHGNVHNSTVNTVNTDNKSSQYADAERIIKEQSKIEWPTDHEMQLYYINNQRTAVEELKKGKPADLSDEEFATIRRIAEAEWPLNFEMRLYKETNQIASLRALREL